MHGRDSYYIKGLNLARQESTAQYDTGSTPITASVVLRVVYLIPIHLTVKDIVRYGGYLTQYCGYTMEVAKRL